MKQTFYIRRYGWKVTVWYLDLADDDAYDMIMQSLYDVGCSANKMMDVETLLCTGYLNCGVTYSNTRSKESVMVIGRTSSAEECANTLIHERKHLEYHICQAFGINPYSEAAAYLAGDIGAAMYKHAQVLLCKDCRENALSATYE